MELRHWDEVGRLVRARRWDVTPTSDINAALPTGAPVVDLRYYYNANDERTLKEAVDSVNSANTVYTAYLFASLELKRARYGTNYNVGSSGSDYELTNYTVVPYLISGGVRLGRLVYESLGRVQEADPGTGPTQTNVAGRQAHIYLELTDHLGSSSLTIDKATSSGSFYARDLAARGHPPSWRRSANPPDQSRVRSCAWSVHNSGHPIRVFRCDGPILLFDLVKFAPHLRPEMDGASPRPRAIQPEKRLAVAREGSVRLHSVASLRGERALRER